MDFTLSRTGRSRHWIIAGRGYRGAGLLLGGLGSGAARVLAAPGPDLAAVENAVVVCVHLVEPRRRALSRPLLGALDELVSRDAAAA